MADVVGQVRDAAVEVFGGRPVVHVGGVLAGMGPLVAELRAAGASRMLLMPGAVGTGSLPEGDDVEVVMLEPEPASTATGQFRAEERVCADPPAALVDTILRFAGGAEPVVLAQVFGAVRAFGPFPVYGARRAEWVALEDKTVGDTLFDAAGVPRPPAVVAPVDADALDAATRQLDRGAGTVWAGDAREGFNGGAEFVRWVRDEESRRGALDHFTEHCDRVRVSPFLDGVPCSIHGFVGAHGVAVFRPVELMTFRVDEPRGLRYAGAATYYDPSPDDRDVMRRSVRRMGACLRDRVGFRGAFGIDGIASADGWVATECNPRAGAGLSYAGVLLPELLLGLGQRVAAAGALADLDTDGLQALVLTVADAQRWGGAWTWTTRVQSAAQTTPIVGDEHGFRRAADDDVADATITLGPNPAGGFVRFEPVPERTPVGPSLAPRAAAAFAWADAELDAGVGPVAPALSLR